MKISIVFEDAGMNADGSGAFNVYLEGLDPARKKLRPDELGPAEYHAIMCFQIVGQILNDVGATQGLSIQGGPKPGKG